MSRIAFLLNNDFQFDSRVQREAIALTQAGHAVTVFCTMDKLKSLPKHSEKEGIRICRTFCKPVHSFQPITMRHIVGVTSILAGKYGQFDVVHAHDANMLLVGWLLARLWGCKLIYDAHELWDSMYQFERTQTELMPLLARKKRKTIRRIEYTRQLERWLLPRTQALISVNDSLCRILNETAHLPKERCLSLRNTAEYFESPEKKGRLFHEHFHLSPETKILLYQGEIKPVRGIDLLLDTMELLPQPDLALVLMGAIPNGEYEQQLHERVANSASLQGRVFFKEQVIRKELIAWTTSADLGIAPILNIRASYYYCLPNKLFEYIQAEIPCATSDFPELKAIVEGYDVGFTFNPEHPQTLAEAVIDFFQHPDRAERYRKNAHNSKRELCWEQEQHKLISLYSQL